MKKIYANTTEMVTELLGEVCKLNPLLNIECPHGWTISSYVLHMFPAEAKYIRAAHKHFIDELVPENISYEFTKTLIARPIKEGERFIMGFYDEGFIAGKHEADEEHQKEILRLKVLHSDSVDFLQKALDGANAEIASYKRSNHTLIQQRDAAELVNKNGFREWCDDCQQLERDCTCSF